MRNLTRWGRTVRDSVITAPRFAAVNTSTAINRQLQSRDMTDEDRGQPDQPDDALRHGQSSHTPSPPGSSSPRETSVNFARTGPAAPTADLYHPNPHSIRMPGPIVRSGARTDGAAASAAAYAFDTVNSASNSS